MLEKGTMSPEVANIFDWYLIILLLFTLFGVGLNVVF
jgi:hypothetical protein